MPKTPDPQEVAHSQRAASILSAAASLDATAMAVLDSLPPAPAGVALLIGSLSVVQQAALCLAMECGNQEARRHTFLEETRRFLETTNRAQAERFGVAMEKIPDVHPSRIREVTLNRLNAINAEILALVGELHDIAGPQLAELKRRVDEGAQG